MAVAEQFEVLRQLPSGEWEFVAGFADLDVATAVATRRTPPVKLVRVTYENGRRVSEDVLAQIGSGSSGA